ncbi:MAG: glutamine amidotransferase [Rothia sp. (in: high G+C Gram-positive bacteria)]|uniref:glutamine amidotransferase n=1 Tax=Rothia sp. (in: high G+C Gram-positive bacteria) TaxID=1885016 RepID=UPI00270CA8F6|nr:glutamine amidotransferase [Rothia sp. (in: high G+C Gram-positive bacteria)]
MPHTAYAVRHVAFEDLGIFEDLLTERGFSVEYRDAGIDALNTPEVREADLLIILGAPISVNNTQNYPFLFEEVELIKARISAQKPVLGICLGAQQIALAAGAQVDPTGEIELGYSPVELTEAGEESVLAPLGNTPVLHWHGDAFTLPEGTSSLARTQMCENQAFTLKDEAGRPYALALQFHLEVNPRHIEQWLIAYADYIRASEQDVAVIRREASLYAEKLTAAATDVLKGWLEQVNL